MTSRRVYPILAIIVAAIHFALASRAATGKSATFDEMAHVTGGYAYWKLNDYRVQPENGNWSQRIVALPVVLGGARFPSLDQPDWNTSNFWVISEQFFFSSGNDADRMLASSRRVVALVSALLCLLVFFWSRSLWGYAGAWVSLTLIAFSPTLLAHGGLATSDVIAAAFFLGALWALWTALHVVTPRTVLVSAVLTGGLFLAKYSAIVFIPVALTLLVIRMRRKPARKTLLVGVAGIHVIAVATLLWASYGFRYSAFNPELPPASQFIDPWNEVVRESSAVGRVVQWSRRHEVLPEAYLYGLSTVDAYSQNRSAFLNGETSRSGGWRWFFPYAALMKTTLPSLLLLALAPVILWHARRRAEADETGSPEPLPLYQLTPLLAFAGWYWIMAIASRLNIGHRHLIPVIAVTAIFLGAAGEPIAAVWRTKLRSLVERPHVNLRRVPRSTVATAGIVVALLGWHVVEALRVSPDFLAYFNQLVGGPDNGYQHLVDSSLDWGQDLPGLRKWLDQNGLQAPNHPPVYLSYFGSSRPEYYHIDAVALPGFRDRWTPRKPPRLTGGVYCISATMLQAVYVLDAPGAWTPEYEKRYQDVRYNLRLFDSTAANPKDRAALLRQTGDEFWWKAFHLAENLRFARLAAFLRHRTPDANVGHSILIYRLTDDDVARAVDGPPP